MELLTGMEIAHMRDQIFSMLSQLTVKVSEPDNAQDTSKFKIRIVLELALAQWAVISLSQSREFSSWKQTATRPSHVVKFFPMLSLLKVG